MTTKTTEQRRRELLKKARDVREKLLSPATNNYTLRAAFLATWQLSDLGSGEAVSDYPLSLEDVDLLIAQLDVSPAQHFERGTKAAADLCDTRAALAQEEQAKHEESTDDDAEGRADQCEAAAHALTLAAEDIRCLLP